MRSVSALSAGAYTATLYMMLNIVKGRGGRGVYQREAKSQRTGTDRYLVQLSF
jgi:hypothetical protein